MQAIGLTRSELRNLISATLAKKVIKLDSETPPRISDVYAWVESLLGHHSRVWIEVLIEVLSENNQRIAQQLSKEK